MCCTWLAENTGLKNDAKNHHLGTIPQLCRAISSQLRHVSTTGKKLVKQQYLFHMCPQYGELRPTSGLDRFGSLGHPSYFQRLPRLGSITARHVYIVVGVSQILRRWTEGATYVRHGIHHVGHWPTFLVLDITKCGKKVCGYNTLGRSADNLIQRIMMAPTIRAFNACGMN